MAWIKLPPGELPGERLAVVLPDDGSRMAEGLGRPRLGRDISPDGQPESHGHLSGRFGVPPADERSPPVHVGDGPVVGADPVIRRVRLGAVHGKLIPAGVGVGRVQVRLRQLHEAYRGVGGGLQREGQMNGPPRRIDDSQPLNVFGKFQLRRPVVGGDRAPDGDVLVGLGGALPAKAPVILLDRGVVGVINLAVTIDVERAMDGQPVNCVCGLRKGLVTGELEGVAHDLIGRSNGALGWRIKEHFLGGRIEDRTRGFGVGPPQQLTGPAVAVGAGRDIRVDGEVEGHVLAGQLPVPEVCAPEGDLRDRPALLAEEIVGQEDFGGRTAVAGSAAHIDAALQVGQAHPFLVLLNGADGEAQIPLGVQIDDRLAEGVGARVGAAGQHAHGDIWGWGGRVARPGRPPDGIRWVVGRGVESQGTQPVDVAGTRLGEGRGMSQFDVEPVNDLVGPRARVVVHAHACPRQAFRANIGSGRPQALAGVAPGRVHASLNIRPDGQANRWDGRIGFRVVPSLPVLE
ncbi:MAG: hypothetical protein BWZ02_02283 [Lentisphaerae bacterium ADurb.BinA184]|nr:MAG: hypothetical protein BWZ02_02283 [Lentisphaerae bacterium ADurb.BinA184]